MGIFLRKLNNFPQVIQRIGEETKYVSPDKIKKMNLHTFVFFAIIIGFFSCQEVETAENLEISEKVELSGNLKFGVHEVGFRQIKVDQDTSLLINLWYPAKEKRKKLVLSGYLNYKNDKSQEDLLYQISNAVGGTDSLFSKDSLELLLNAQMYASLNTETEQGKFPLLIWTMRYGTVEYQNLISEYIASHGYLVAFAEDIPNTPFPWMLPSSNDKVNAFNKQIRDINTAIAFLKLQDNIDTSKLGVLTWSYAGESAVLIQKNNPEIDLVVGLSAIGFNYGVYLGNAFPDSIDINKMDVPYLLMIETIAPNRKPRTVPEQLNSMHAHSRYVSFKDLAHGSFNVLEGMVPGILNTDKVQIWSKGGAVAQTGFETICEITVNYLDAVLHEQNMDTFESQIESMQKRLPEKFFSVTSPRSD